MILASNTTGVLGRYFYFTCPTCRKRSRQTIATHVQCPFCKYEVKPTEKK